jgi:hypothetical protein
MTLLSLVAGCQLQVESFNPLADAANLQPATFNLHPLQT